MAQYFLVKVETTESARSVVAALIEALDSDNMYKHVTRALVCDVNNSEVQAVLDCTALEQTVTETIDR